MLRRTDRSKATDCATKHSKHNTIIGSEIEIPLGFVMA